MTLGKAKWILVAYVVLDLLIGYAGVIPLGQAAAAQFTTVTGTVVDPNSLPYAFGTIVPTLVTSASPTLNGFAYTPPTQPVGLDKNGSFTMQLADNTVLLPAGTKWNFLVCSAVGTIQPAGGKGPVCFSLAAPITISGASQSISANLNAVALALSSITGGSTLTINPTNGVIPVRSNATTFIDSPLSVSGSNVANSGTFLGPQGCSTPAFSFSAVTNGGLCSDSVDNRPRLAVAGTEEVGWTAGGGIFIPPGDAFIFNNGALTGGLAVRASISNPSTTIFNFGAQDSTGKLQAAAYISAGTTFTASGCANSTLVGGASAGTYTSVTAGSCTVTITMGNSSTSAHGWVCDAHDITTVADANNVTMGSSTTTTANLVEGTVAANDVIAFKCTGE
jgi:hypothetical protein